MKTYEVDGEVITMGSMNQDITSFFCNNEANMLVKSTQDTQPLFGHYNKVFSSIKSECNRVDPNEEYSKVGWLKQKYWWFFLDGVYHAMRNTKKGWTGSKD